ncbi:uncharacterized protein J3D65DRAFT_250834 [Phyllosticta citribraziliensis]|uniref:Uncharacterized protein n=1 Tax=Phyllosticta citribraziliensis TaxID=989973 RepID=A0ABR1LZT3_9PEZI
MRKWMVRSVIERARGKRRASRQEQQVRMAASLCSAGGPRPRRGAARERVVMAGVVLRSHGMAGWSSNEDIDKLRALSKGLGVGLVVVTYWIFSLIRLPPLARAARPLLPLLFTFTFTFTFTTSQLHLRVASCRLALSSLRTHSVASVASTPSSPWHVTSFSSTKPQLRYPFEPPWPSLSPSAPLTLFSPPGLQLARPSLPLSNFLLLNSAIW